MFDTYSSADQGVAVLTLLTTRLHYSDTARWLVLPTGRTVDQLGQDLSDAWRLFGDVAAPTEVAPGFVVVAMAAVTLVAVMADWAAFRLRVPFEGLLPAAGLFGFSATFSPDESRAGPTARRRIAPESRIRR